MTTEQIHQAFQEMIFKHRVAYKVKMKPNAVKQIRYKLRHGKCNYSLDFKLKLLQRAGYRIDALKYSDLDIIEVLRFALLTSQAARDRGPEYIFEKFKSTRGQNVSVLSKLKSAD